MAKQSITQATMSTNNIQSQADQVVNAAAALKLAFDQFGIDTKTFINSTLIPQLESIASGTPGSTCIGHNSTNVTADNLGDGLEEVAKIAKGANPTLNITSVLDYGAVGDGATDDTTAIQLAIDAMDDGGILFFPTTGSNYIINGTVIISGRTNIKIYNASIGGTSTSTFQISGNSKSIIFENCYFTGVGQIIHLWACDSVIVSKCTFYDAGYGVIQQIGYVSNNVIVDSCICEEMEMDFVNANCANVESKNWIVSRNIFKNNNGYPTPVGTENRFVSFTRVENIIIASNICEEAGGDSAIHLEEPLGDVTILGNTLDNCIGTNGYIYITNNEKTCLVANNTFKRSDATLVKSSALSVENGTLTNNILFVNNRVIGVNKNLDGINIKFQTNPMIKCNEFNDCETGVLVANTHDFDVIGNTFNDCDRGLWTGGSGTPALTNLLFANNRFKGTVTNCVEIRRNVSGTSGSSSCQFTGNHFDADAIAYDTTDFVATCNVTATGSEIDFGKTQYVGSVNYQHAINTVFGGDISPIKPLTSISATPSFIGQTAVVASVGYFSVGTASTADWKQITV